MKTIDIKHNNFACLELGYMSDYAKAFNLDRIKLELNPETIKNIIEAQEILKLHPWFKYISIDCSAEFFYDGEEITDYNPDVVTLRISKYYIILYSQDKYNFECQIESEEFQLV